MSKSIIVIGAGIGGLATACILAKAGYKVSIYEKTSEVGGKAGILKSDGFTFDTGPSWYLMPDVFENFFKLLGEDVNQLFELKKLSPSYRLFFKDTLLGPVDIYGDLKEDAKTLEALEPNARQKLDTYLEKSEKHYKIAMDQFLYKNYDSAFDFLTPKLVKESLNMNIFSSMQSYVSKNFSSTEVQKIMQYSLVFLGASPKNAPALYSIMGHVDFNQGVFYPIGGIHQLTKNLQKLAKKYGVKIHLNSPVSSINVTNKDSATASGITVRNKKIDADVVICNADVAYADQKLLQPKYRSYSKRYWDKRTMAPSALVMYLGVKANYPNLRHHNLVFSKDWTENFKAIFDTKKWPADPSFYVCNPNKTEKKLAPKNHENLFVLVPLPATTKYKQSELEHYADHILKTMEQTMNLKDLRQKIVYKKLFAAKDYQETWNSHKGSALGLAHTLKQTAVFRPNNKSKKVSNLYFVGANTVPGIGLPMCLISAQLVYKRLIGDKSNSPINKQIEPIVN